MVAVVTLNSSILYLFSCHDLGSPQPNAETGFGVQDPLWRSIPAKGRDV